MPTDPLHQLVPFLLRGADPALTDGELLESYVRSRDEAALAALVRRHGPMVWAVCRRLTGDHHDAEDAFQATFLVLVRRAASVRPRAMVANWLYGVARQTARKARQTAAKRKAREKQMTTMPEPAAAPEPANDLQPVIDEELGRLPAKYRAVVLLCDVEGRARPDVARQLGVPEGTVASRLARARDLLARRLSRRGVALAGLTLAAAAVPPAVASSTIQATGVPARVAALAEGVVRAMLLQKLKTIAVAVLLVGTVGAGGGLLTRHMLAAPPPAAAGKKADDAGRPSAEAGREDFAIKVREHLQITAANTLPDSPINGAFLVEPQGTVNLGVPYGRVRVAGRSLEDAEVALRNHLARFLKEPQVSVSRYDPVAHGDSALEGRVRLLEKEVQNLKEAVRKLQGQRGP